MQKCCSFERDNKKVEMLFLEKGTTKMQKCCSFGKEQQKGGNFVPSKRNNKMQKKCKNAKICTESNLYK